MKRNAALAAIKAAGTQNDTKAFTRLYTENRISLAAAKAAFAEGRKFAAFVTERDAATKSPGQLAYEADVAKRPRYGDGTPRKTWSELGDVERWSWGRGA